MKMSQQVEQMQNQWDELHDAGVLHVDSVLEACKRDEKKTEKTARRSNRTRTVHALNSWLNHRGIYMRNPATHPKPPVKLRYFRKQEAV